VSKIEAFVAELDDKLRGPRSVKADMLAEVRDGLLDATEAYKHSGLDEDGAQRQAVADFGAVPEVAADYQVELGLSQARRTGVLISVALAAQPVAWHLLWHLVGRQGDSTTTYLTVNAIVRWAGTAAIAGGLLTVIALGVGTRYLGSRALLTRATGIFAFAVCGVFASLGLLLTAVSPATGPLLAWSGLPSTLVLLGLPLVGIGVAARECMATA
jgi:hypothetical protein